MRRWSPAIVRLVDTRHPLLLGRALPEGGWLPVRSRDPGTPAKRAGFIAPGTAAAYSNAAGESKPEFVQRRRRSVLRGLASKRISGRRIGKGHRALRLSAACSRSAALLNNNEPSAHCRGRQPHGKNHQCFETTSGIGAAARCACGCSLRKAWVCTPKRRNKRLLSSAGSGGVLVGSNFHDHVFERGSMGLHQS